MQTAEGGNGAPASSSQADKGIAQGKSQRKDARQDGGQVRAAEGTDRAMASRFSLEDQAEGRGVRRHASASTQVSRLQRASTPNRGAPGC